VAFFPRGNPIYAKRGIAMFPVGGEEAMHKGLTENRPQGIGRTRLEIRKC
jgi:hypothetical protein